MNLYFGSDCNRACDFCCVEGRPGGSFHPFDDAVVDTLLDHLLPHGRVKLYGGEPTLHHDHLTDVIARLRARGYVGRWTIFSNGIRARRLVDMLEADPPTAAHPGSDAYLNHRIWHGTGVEPIPEGRRRLLLEWASSNPGRLWLGHEEVLPVGAASAGDGGDGCSGPAERREGRDREVPAAGSAPAEPPDAALGDGCARCWPTVRSDGRLHACAFAVEVDAPLYDLGRVGDAPESVTERRTAFLEWMETVLEPAAAAAGERACTLCLRHAEASRLVTLEGCGSPGPPAGGR